MKKVLIVALMSAWVPALMALEGYTDVTDTRDLMIAPENGTEPYFNAAAEDSYLGNLRVHKNKSSAYAVSAGVNVDAGKKLTIGKLRGCRGQSGTFTKTGAGTLAILDGAAFGTPIHLMGGTLELAHRAIPTRAQLPEGLVMAFDASDLTSMTLQEDATKGKTYLGFWGNLATKDWMGTRVTGLQPLDVWKHPKFFRPWLLRNALGPGLHAVDFGLYYDKSDNCYKSATTYSGEYWTYDNATMSFVTNESYTASTRMPVTNICTIVAVASSQHGGGSWADAGDGENGAWGKNPFERGGANYNGRGNWDWPLGRTSTVKGVETTPDVWLDGRKVSISQHYEGQACFQVVATRMNPQTFKFGHIGCRNDTGNAQILPGGPLLAEILYFDRELTDEEICDVQAYLMWKWFKAAAPGYRRTDGQAVLQEVLIGAASAIEVPAGQTNRIAKLSINAPLTKRGDGVLEVFECNVSDSITYAGGEIRLVSRPDAGDDSYAVAPGASMHLDPSQDGTAVCDMTTDGTNRVLAVNLIAGRNACYYDGSRPYFVTNSPLQGLTQYYCGPKHNSGPGLIFQEPLDGVKSVYFVVGNQANGYIMGAQNNTSYDAYNKNGAVFDYFRDKCDWSVSASTANQRIIWNNGNDALSYDTNVQLYTNGVAASCSAAKPLPDFQLIEIHGPNPTHISALKDTLARGAGGGWIGEFIAYERTLTDREKVSTRNYLMKKWFAQTTPTALPEKPADRNELVLPYVMRVDGDLAIATDSVHSNLMVSGNGSISLTGSGTLQMADLLSFTGTVRVAGGTFAVTGHATDVTPQLATDGRLLHLDANEGLQLVTNGAVYTVTQWVSKVGGYYAYRGSLGSGSIGAITYEKSGFRGRPKVYIPRGNMMYFRDSNNTNCHVGKIRSALWVLGSQHGGGWMLGGGMNYDGGYKGYAWHRGSEGGGADAGASHLDHILCNSAPQSTFFASWRKNGRAIDSRSTGLSGDWDMLSCVLREANDEWVTAQGLCADIRGSEVGSNRSGRQELAELVLYDRYLSDAERAQAEAYLNIKWGLNNVVASGTNNVTALVASGAQLDCGGTNQYFAAVGGAGAVVNGGVETRRLVYDFESPGALDAAAITFLENCVIEFRNAPAKIDFMEVPVLTSAQVTGLKDLLAAKVVGLPAGCPAKFKWQNGTLTLRLGRRGVIIFVQ